MPKLLIFCLASLLAAAQCGQASPGAAGTDPKTETVVLIRHGEKPLLGLGQLDCRGLNRALALPDVLIPKFGKADIIYAPNPAGKAHDLGGTFDYVRPLITIEPTAVRLGLPVNCDFQFDNIKGLAADLLSPSHRGKLIFVAWEHVKLNEMVKDILRQSGADPHKVPDWPESDYDRIYILRVSPDAHTINLAVDHENLNHLSDNCSTGGNGK
ncbi:MAG: hypothetical protein JO271_09740 [Verrucomicrobia bacterium]|nr:hypothetical protein [Verrucomicrobiota bacterium]MBV9272787.1 hypothetical protein [Verrucomicrobiota bacterium]